MPANLYLPEDPDYTLVDSVRDSVRFAHFCLEPHSHGRWAARSSAVSGDGKPAPGHSLACLEGPGGEANALGGALTLYRWSRFDQNHILEKVALGLLDHVLHAGFVPKGGPIRPFHDTESGAFFLNSSREEEWYEPADQARMALQMLRWAEALPAGDARSNHLCSAAAQIGGMLAEDLGDDGDWPAARGNAKGRTGEAGGEGLYVSWLLLELSRLGLVEYTEAPRRLLDSFVRLGGIFGWGSTDGDSTRGRALAIRVLRTAAERLRDPSLGDFALGVILPPLEQRLIREDLGGLPTMGLVASTADSRVVNMADVAECSLSCQEASETTGDRDHLCAGVTMLRAVARFHRLTAEPHGFLAAGLDFGSQDTDAALRPNSWTSPLFSNLLHVDAALHYLSRRVA